ncbi:hypothetical protein IMCC9480_735 [Oxalobacteraceae bacterium IMCC9480]|nr:hypothetical protein IMCC9480_735 [Oxalobacteraceae bacterium IMCC9480]
MLEFDDVPPHLPACPDLDRIDGAQRLPARLTDQFAKVE